MGHREGGSGLGVWGEECGVWRYGGIQQSTGIVTRAPEQHEQVTKGHTPRGGVQSKGSQRSKGTGEGRGQEQCRKDPG